MICQRCKNSAATVCVSRVVNNQKVDIYLCSDCADKSAAFELKKAFTFLEAMPGHFVFGDNYGNVQKRVSVERCPVCKKSLLEISKDGKLGCANCYVSFKEKLRPTVIRIHRNTQHRGKKPRWVEELSVDPAMPSARGARDTNETPDIGDARDMGDSTEIPVENLRAALDAAVLAEEYERAAQLRDRIKMIRNADRNG